MIGRIALRNILRHKRRTILSAITIAAGLMVFIFMNSLIAGLDRGMIDNMVELSTSALKVTTSRYESEKKSFPLDYGLADPQGLSRFLLADRRVRSVTSRVQFAGQLSNNSETMPVTGTVIDVSRDTTVFSLHRYLEGAYFGDKGSREIIVGKKLATDLGLAVGDYVTLYALTRYESRNADEFRIVGLLNTTDPALNFAAVYISSETGEDFLDLDGLVTELDVSLRDRGDLQGFVATTRDLQTKVRSRYPDLAPNTFLELGAGIIEMSRVRQIFGFVFMMVVFLIAAVGIFNTVFMSVYERIREIGVLRAHGMRGREVTILFLLEGFVTGVAGSLLGLTLGCLLNAYLVAYGYPLDKIAGESHTSEIPFFGTAYGVWNPDMLALAFVAGVAIATLAAVVPAYRASRLQVTQALRFV